MGKTFAEKILAIKSGRKEVKAGEIVEVYPDWVMSHENAALVAKIWNSLKEEKVKYPQKIVLIFDHRVPAESVKTAIGQKEVREFAKIQGITNFFDINKGICHQVMVEEGFVAPGELILGTDSHTTTYGALGAFSTGIGATEMAGVWATGKLWLRVPETIKIILKGSLTYPVSAKDVILHIIGKLGADGADYREVEFAGEGIRGFSISDRLTLCNLSMEMGAKGAVCFADEKTLDYIQDRVKRAYSIITADVDANYEQTLEFDISKLTPQIALPHRVDNVKSVADVEGLPIDQAVVGSCTNGRLEDLEITARILEGKKVASSVRMIIIPASWNIYLEALKKGFIEIFINAGAVVINPGCGPCLGAHQGLLAPGERCITSTNRNFKGRMGSGEAEIYLASPAVVAASAIKGKITIPPERK